MANERGQVSEPERIRQTIELLNRALANCYDYLAKLEQQADAPPRPDTPPAMLH